MSCYGSILLWTLLTGGGGRQGKFDLPQTYDRSYCIPFSIVPPGLAYKLRKEQDRRSERREEKSLTMDHLYEFRTVLRHFINFKQKQKVIWLKKGRIIVGGGSDSYTNLYHY